MAIYILNINSNGQITLPATYRNIWKLKPNTKIKVKISKNKTFTILNSVTNNYNLDDLPNIIGKIEPISETKIQKELSKSFNPRKI